MSDPTSDLVSGLKSDLQQIRQQREKILNEQNDFFNRFYADHFTFQPNSYQVNISDSEEEEEPTRMRIMTMRTQTIFEKKPKKKKEKPPPEEIIQLPPPVVAKPICIDRACQSKKVEFRTLETQTSIKSTYKDAAIVATSSTEVQTDALRLRSESTNTDSVLPSYENVCIAFLESLLEDAPVLINNGPKPEQLEGILMDFLNQLIRDAKDFDLNNDQVNSSNSSGDKSILSNGPLLKKAKLVDANTQQEVSVKATATQSPISLKVLEAPSVVINYIPPPNESHDFVGSFVPPKACFDQPPNRRLIQMRKGDHFSFPPSLRTEPEKKPPVKLVKQSAEIFSRQEKEMQRQIPQEEAKKPPKKMFQIDIMENLNVKPSKDQKVGPQGGNQPILPLGPSIPQQPQEEPQVPQIDQQQPDVNQANKPPQKKKRQIPQIPKINDLHIRPLEDLEELSEFNIDSYLKDLNSSSDEDEIDTSNIQSGDYSFSVYNSINESTIDKALNSSSVSIGTISEEPLSSGEVRDYSFTDSNYESNESETGQWTSH